MNFGPIPAAPVAPKAGDRIEIVKAPAFTRLVDKDGDPWFVTNHGAAFRPDEPDRRTEVPHVGLDAAEDRFGPFTVAGMPVRVLVCGGRWFGRLNDDPRMTPEKRAAEEARVARQRRLAFDTLDAIHRETYTACIVYGCAPGADMLGKQWAEAERRHGWVGLAPFPADWEKYGKGAGPRRNKQMLDEGNPDLVVAFPGGRGTADMIQRARAAGVRVIEVQEPEDAPRE